MTQFLETFNSCWYDAIDAIAVALPFSICLTTIIGAVWLLVAFITESVNKKRARDNVTKISINKKHN